MLTIHVFYYAINTESEYANLMAKGESEKQKTIRDLYPHFNEEQLQEAERNLEEYLELSLRIYERIQSDPTAYALFKELLAGRRRKEGDSASD